MRGPSPISVSFSWLATVNGLAGQQTPKIPPSQAARSSSREETVFRASLAPEVHTDGKRRSPISPRSRFSIFGVPQFLRQLSGEEVTALLAEAIFLGHRLTTQETLRRSWYLHSFHSVDSGLEGEILLIADRGLSKVVGPDADEKKATLHLDRTKPVALEVSLHYSESLAASVLVSD
jgi:hypothetical protein